jgi:hypothetical protein
VWVQLTLPAGASPSSAAKVSPGDTPAAVLDEEDTDPKFDPGAGPEPDAGAGSEDALGPIIDEAGVGFPCAGTTPREPSPAAGSALDACWPGCAERMDRADKSKEALDLEAALRPEAVATSEG